MIMSHLVHPWAVVPVLDVDGQFAAADFSVAGQIDLFVVVVMHIEKAVGGVGDVVVVGDWHGDVVGDGDLRNRGGLLYFDVSIMALKK